MKLRLAYFINQYPKVSHSFIRREILALERQGHDVLRLALRGWDAEIVDADDISERDKTTYVLRGGIFPLIVAYARVFIGAPRKFLRAFMLAVRLSHKAERALPYHLIYLAEACRILPLLKSFGTMHVHAHFGTNSAEVVMLAHVLGGPSFSFTVHGPEEFDKAQALYLREKICHAEFVVAISSYGRSQLFRWAEYRHWHKIKVVHCGLEQNFHNLAPVTSSGMPRMVCVGRLCEQKGQLLLIEALARLKARNIAFEMVLAGDGEMRGEIETLIANLGLEDRVSITGWISSERVRAEILAARALVLPSFAEGLPVVIMEAMALRRPVLTTYVAGIPELVIPGENGWLFPAGDIEALASTMEDLLSRTPKELELMGAAAHARAIERHSIDTETAKLTGLFCEAIGAKPGSE